MIDGLCCYGELVFVKDIGMCFLFDVKYVYVIEGKFVEKYVVEGIGMGGGGGGEYLL